MGRIEWAFMHGGRDITARKSIEWGDVEKDKDGNRTIRYKFYATIWDKDVMILNQVFTFDAKGNILDVTDVEGFPQKKVAKPADVSTQAGMKELVEDFFSKNFRDITSRKTIEWGERHQGRQRQLFDPLQIRGQDLGQGNQDHQPGLHFRSEGQVCFREGRRGISARRRRECSGSSPSGSTRCTRRFRTFRTTKTCPRRRPPMPRSSGLMPPKATPFGRVSAPLISRNTCRTRSQGTDLPRSKRNGCWPRDRRSPRLGRKRRGGNRPADRLPEKWHYIDLRWLTRVDGRWLNFGNDVEDTLEQGAPENCPKSNQLDPE